MKQSLIKQSLIKKWLQRLATMAIGVVIALIGAYGYQIQQLPDTRPWHTNFLDESHLTRHITSFDAYLSHENRLFEQLGNGIAKLNNQEAWNRFSPTSPANPLNYPYNLNRTHIWPVDNPVGGALLTHGLSDSPYSLNALAYQLASSGYYVINLRIPGHGTAPGNLSTTTLEDFRLSYRLAMEHLHSIVGDQKPILAAGYSNGAALAVDYNLSAINNQSRTADGLFLMSPAFQVSGVVRLAGYLKYLAAIPGLEKVAWSSIQPEYDPYKYNSFPIAAGEQIYRLTEDITTKLQALKSNQQLTHFPGTLVIQSVVDATIPPKSVVDRFLNHLPPDKAELVLFDVNRLQQLEVFIAQKHRPFLQAIKQQASLPFDFTLISNRTPDDRQVEARHRKHDSNDWSATPLPYRWPEDVYSLSHVAVPFTANDPIYGEADAQSATHTGLPLLGQLSARGERGTFVVSMDQLQRLRYNPFYGYIEMRLDQFLMQLATES
jgi:esterase/lipase